MKKKGRGRGEKGEKTDRKALILFQVL